MCEVGNGTFSLHKQSARHGAVRVFAGVDVERWVRHACHAPLLSVSGAVPVAVGRR